MIVRANKYPAEERANMRGGEGSAFLTPLVKDELPANCRLFNTIELPVGASIGYHVHEGETEIFYFLKGNGRVQDDEALLDIAAGDSLVTSSGHGHAVFNTGNEPLLFLASIVLD